MRKQIHWKSKDIFWSNVLQHSRSCPPQSKSSKRIDCYQHIQNDFSVTFFGIKPLQVRKKGRNKQHATNCRSRKENELKLLQVCKYSVNKSRLKCSFFQRKLRKKKEKFNKEKLLNAELLTDFGKREWECEVLKHRCQKLVSWKIKWEEIETPFPTSVFWTAKKYQDIKTAENPFSEINTAQYKQK